MKKESLNINIKKQTLKGNFSAIAFKEGETQIVYIPSLQLSSYGDTLDEAREMMEKVLHDFSKNLVTLPEAKVNSILTNLGWKKDSIFKKRMTNLSETTFDDIIKEFNLPKDTPVQEIPIAV